ncbi:MAG: hypothetical protein IIB26_09410 [Chloroflexi bacterium]|nr:hypothetical protein [Chloroflexota bacterium]
MSPETLDRVYEPYFSTKSHGRGLGMAAVYGIAKNHLGAIHGTSELGEGTRFDLYLPATKADVEEVAVQAPHPEVRGTETVLVVEDEAMVAAYGFDRRTLDAMWRESVGASPLVEETVARTPTARPLPTFVPYTLENLGAAPTSTPAPDEAVSQPEATAAPESGQESDNEGGSGGGCSAAGPGAPIEGGMALMILAVGSAAAFRTLRGKGGS